AGLLDIMPPVLNRSEHPYALRCDRLSRKVRAATLRHRVITLSGTHFAHGADRAVPAVVGIAGTLAGRAHFSKVVRRLSPASSAAAATVRRASRRRSNR